MSLHSSFGYDSLRLVIFAKAIKECEKIQNEYHQSESCSDIKSNISSDSEKHLFDRYFLKICKREYSLESESQIIFNNQSHSLSQFISQK